MFGGIEAGGTKFVCGIGTGPGDLKIAQFPTSTPDVTLQGVIRFFQESQSKIDAVGIGSFGPVDLNRSSPHFGHVTSTPKVGWLNFDLAGAVQSALNVPVGFETDVNVALLGEARWGAARGLTDAVYLTIGTGVGGGAMIGGQLAHGLIHPEMGHLRLPHDLARDPFPGACPYHGDCFEGLACGPAIQARWGMLATVLPPDHPAWALEAHYIALGIANLAFTLSPQRILLGGGVMQQAHLFGEIRREFAQLLNHYLVHPELENHLERYIQPPELGGLAGVLGSLVVAEQAANQSAEAVGGSFRGGRA